MDLDDGLDGSAKYRPTGFRTPDRPARSESLCQPKLRRWITTFSIQLTRNLYSFLTLRRLMSYIYMEHPFLMFLDHTQRRSTVGRTPLDE